MFHVEYCSKVGINLWSMPMSLHLDLGVTKLEIPVISGNKMRINQALGISTVKSGKQS